MNEASIPVDDGALELIEIALNSRLDGEDENGDPVRVGEFSLDKLLEFWSGYEQHSSEDISERATEYTGGRMLSTNDLIQALVDEIKRLRG